MSFLLPIASDYRRYNGLEELLNELSRNLKESIKTTPFPFKDDVVFDVDLNRIWIDDTISQIQIGPSFTLKNSGSAVICIIEGMKSRNNFYNARWIAAEIFRKGYIDSTGLVIPLVFDALAIKRAGHISELYSYLRNSNRPIATIMCRNLYLNIIGYKGMYFLISNPYKSSTEYIPISKVLEKINSVWLW